jgi:hypothetical protein
VSGGCVEQELIHRYRSDELGRPFPTRVDFGVDREEAGRLGLPCGGRLELLIEELDTPERDSETVGLTLDSGVQLTKNIDIAGRFNRSPTTTTFRDAETTTRNMTWPDVSLSWKGLENFGPFAGLFTASSATLTYNVTKRESERNQVVESTSETMNLTPSIIFQWKNGIRSTVGVQYGKDTQDTRGSITENTNFRLTTDMKYTFTPGNAVKLPLPFLRNKTLKSRLDTSINGSFSKTGGRRSAGAAGRFVSIPGTTSFGISPRVTYNFSRALNGSLFIDFTRTYNEQSDQTTTIVRIGITATFTF